MKGILKSKFFSHLNQTIELKLYKSLWRITFFTENSKCDLNREINYSALMIVTKRQQNLLKNYNANSDLKIKHRVER